MCSLIISVDIFAFRKFSQIAAFPGIIGCVDGTHIPIKCSQLERGEIFRNRKGRFSINIQVVGGPDLKIYDLVARRPGSVHDSRIFQNSRVKNRLETGLLKGILLGDSGYPQSYYLYTPAPEPVIPQRPNPNTISYNMDLQNYRN
ncbi:putative nuclease HARBI1 [Sipha flava]|uniref:Nuclease HARBI1 n=1 Tax=Sipha flava TaxID=143950 RepID=A0A8B8G1C2_9HEMI|nr:putative nuclease HARBI1 [Sipha flava]